MLPSLIIEDNGKGIPEKAIDKVLSFGGRSPLDNKKITVGRFGWGLSSSACCQSPRTELYSRTNEDWYYSYIDIDELKKQKEPIIPSAIKKVPELDLKIKSTHGTVIFFTLLDRPEYKTVEKLQQHIASHIGETYRHYLLQGKKMFVNETPVTIIDPLMLIPGCKDSDLLGTANDNWEISPIIIKEEIDPETKKPAEIHIKIVIMNLEQIRQNDDWIKLVKKKDLMLTIRGSTLLGIIDKLVEH